MNNIYIKISSSQNHNNGKFGMDNLGTLLGWYRKVSEFGFGRVKTGSMGFFVFSIGWYE